MLAKSEFDKYFQNLPQVNKEKDFDEFWNNSITELKKTPIDPLYKKKQISNTLFDTFDVTFNGFRKTLIRGELHIPRDIRKPKVVITIPDYNRKYIYQQYPLNTNLAFFFLQLRGHEIINNTERNKEEMPGYITENILSKDNYYVKNIYLDACRSIDALRLNRKLDCSSIGIIGKGLGAAASLFMAAFSKKVAAVVLDTPAFCHLQLNQNISKSDATKEINDYLSNNKSKKNQIKINLSYFDSINLAENVRCPVLTTVGFKDTLSPPECIFALFNHLLCEKTMEIYPDQGNEAGGEDQFIKSINWLYDIMENHNQ
ncbi:MAG: acetylxylan esterase [Spirochaetota bacterium]|nr:acetylxylan esterase [Spirochaetota bacterium]